ncbi:MAG: hypothetical protein J6V50_06230 [Clostridia bacterium]|nr:hypothetical protein [Clostridia bacterium]
MFRRRKGEKKEKNYRVIDFHSHILPGVDHGSKSLDISLSQLRLMEKAGIDVAVATSHFYPHREEIDDFLKKREKAAEQLRSAKSDAVKVALGAEVYCVAGLEEKEWLEKLTIKGTNTLLLEMPMAFWNNNIIDTVLALDERFDLVLAHIDRYPSSNLDKLLYLKIKTQINALNTLRGPNRSRLPAWLYDGHVSAIGSDLHEVDKRAVKSVVKLEKALKDSAEEIFQRTEKLIKGADLI